MTYRIIEEKIDGVIFKKIIITNSYLFKQNVNFILISKPYQIQLRPIFNYYIIFKDILAN